jgi:demethylmenaquinone methyltransferase/2-methoxy-6-polyprenyl-1,4-benzoquinol methylase
LAPGGRFFFIDNARPFEHLVPRFGALAHTDGSVHTPWSSTDVGAGVSERHLSDGRTFNIVKVFYEPTDLQERLTALGWDAAIGATETFFIHGSGARS